MPSIRIQHDFYPAFLYQAEHPDPEELDRRDMFLAGINRRLSPESRPGHPVMEIPDIPIPLSLISSQPMRP